VDIKKVYFEVAAEDNELESDEPGIFDKGRPNSSTE
jgi:hypothetical protein